MSYKEILIFDISSEYGHFRKYNTTTSPLSYSLPPRTAIAGLFGAILGMEREIRAGVYPEGVIPVQDFFNKKNADIGIQIINPVKKETVAMNLINTKHSFYNLSKSGRIQTEFELLKDVKYRIFFNCNDENVLQELIERIKEKRFHFTPYLGLAQFTASIDFVDKIKATHIVNDQNEFVLINTAINLSKVNDKEPVEFNNIGMYSANNMPVEMDKNREVQEYSEVLIENNGKPIKVKAKQFYQTENYGNILFL
ncbi:MAG: type I-B CRISPR-associated protein Cas5b [Bacteroidales bacterium]|nr:type I-B CRISPR-associated protein Cas5b [Bacteroidales bacterium]MCF8337290.1 type I-B CRISPR-associated protein Cas5b [Bacteroidales bacterium]